MLLISQVHRTFLIPQEDASVGYCMIIPSPTAMSIPCRHDIIRDVNISSYHLSKHFLN